MRALFVSNLYPPDFVGGYELGCRDLAVALGRRGHCVEVLTSSSPVSAADDVGVRRLLDRIPRRSAGWRWLSAVVAGESANRRHIRRAIHRFHPDVVLFWNLAGSSLSLVRAAVDSGARVACYVFEDWWARCDRDDAWVNWRSGEPRGLSRRLLKDLLIAVVDGATDPRPGTFLAPECAVFASRYLREVCAATWPWARDSAVIPWGVDARRFAPAPPDRGTSRLLYVGQVVPHKGVHTAIEAVHRLVVTHRRGGVSLTVVGGSLVPEYEARLRRTASDLGVQGFVHFLGKQPPEQIPAIMAEHDVLLFPSVWNEPFGITQLEAMAAGTVVVGTATGGAQEVLRDGVNGLAFPAEDAEACARQVVRVLDDPPLRERLRSVALETVRREFSFDQTVDRMELTLAGAAGARQLGGLEGLP